MRTEHKPAATGHDESAYLERVHPPHWRSPRARESYDLVILGGGPAGHAAALAARGCGLSVALVERDRLGGNSLNIGSVPSKALVRSGRAFEAIVNAPAFAAPAGGSPQADMRLVMQRMRAIRTRIAEACSAQRLADAGVDLFFGTARFVAQKIIQADGVALPFQKALIATGAGPRRPQIPGLAQVGHLTASSFFQLEKLPRRLAIIGGGPLGCEMAQAFAHMGSRVTILQDEPKFLPHEERDAAELLSLSLARSGVETRLNTQVMSARIENGEKVIRANSVGQEFSVAVDEILLSIGRQARVDGLDLGAAGIRLTACGDVEVDGFLQTRNCDVFAAGDVCMVHKFTNMAEATGRLAVRNAFRCDRLPYDELIVPYCTYCDPEIAHVGMHIDEARRAQIPVQSFTVMMQDVDRAIIDGRDDGFVKIHLRLGSDEILGATIVASRASEMINEISVLMHAKMGMRALADVLHTYPAQSDAIRLAARAYVESLQACR